MGTTTTREPMPDVHIGTGDYLVIGGKFWPVDSAAHAEKLGVALLVAAERSHTDGLDLIGDIA